MFDIGFAELLIIGIVALLVIGPERLPEAIRTGSAWLNRLRRGFNDIKQEVQQELHNDEVLRELRDSGKKLRDEGEALKRQLNAPLEDPFGLTPEKKSTLDPQSDQFDAAVGGSASESASDSASESASESASDSASENASGGAKEHLSGSGEQTPSVPEAGSPGADSATEAQTDESRPDDPRPGADNAGSTRD